MIQDGKLRGFAMGQAIPVRTDYTAGEVRRFAHRAPVRTFGCSNRPAIFHIFCTRRAESPILRAFSRVDAAPAPTASWAELAPGRPHVWLSATAPFRRPLVRYRHRRSGTGGRSGPP